MEQPQARRRQYSLAALFGIVTASACFLALARDPPTLAAVSLFTLLTSLGVALVGAGTRMLQRHPEGGVIGCAGLAVAGLGMFLVIPGVMLLLGIVYRVFGQP